MRDSEPLTPQELSRYARHLSLREIGVAGQQRLKASSVLVVGTGGLGSPVALYLAAAGVGRIGLVDFDRVDETNLQRQIIHGTSDVGRSKVDSAAESLAQVNPLITVERYETALSSTNALDIAADYDVVIDGTDNFATRYLVNDVCVLLGKPNCYGSIFGFEGQASVFSWQDGPCYRCLYPKPPPVGMIPNCAEGGVLGVLPGIVGTIQATEAIKLLLEIGDSLSGRLLLFDALEMSFRQLTVKRDSACPVCGDSPTITEPVDYEQFCGVASPNSPQSDFDIQPAELKQRIDSGDRMMILDVREPDEFAICNLGGVLIPLGNLAQQHTDLPRTETIIVHCKSGRRSAQAVEQLRALGFPDVWNLNGGILRWAKEIDPSMPSY
ncbi:molybdopterin-synthase adenylyltransferase MoeB [Stieleria varia]|uniref:Molybdopterin-synthase adenylyltransferase n=1 Tax=Stieleria varia TaxID=2528005 RepID=A0A5C6B2F6_9BACT|nr:molybdopterin-synthase adenylyltransferase MoeB [Stieleria varia]TWU06495.1 putative adenylyltransferase/sulfurtransferase MoeZ [Stieleria varia]